MNVKIYVYVITVHIYICTLIYIYTKTYIYIESMFIYIYEGRMQALRSMLRNARLKGRFISNFGTRFSEVL